jgi:hypothetical protein
VWLCTTGTAPPGFFISPSDVGQPTDPVIRCHRIDQTEKAILIRAAIRLLKYIGER